MKIWEMKNGQPVVGENRNEAVDLEVWESIWQQIARLEAAIFPDPWSQAELERTFALQTTRCIVAEQAGRVCGYLLLCLVLDECEILRIAVDPTIRRQQVGTALLQQLFTMCQEQKITSSLLDVRVSNTGATAFYEQAGFLTDGIRKGYYPGEPPEDARLMSRRMEPEAME